MRALRAMVLLILPGPWSPLYAAVVVDHDLALRLDPRAGAIEVVDRITLPPEHVSTGGEAVFALNRALALEVAGLAPGAIERLDEPHSRVALYRVKLPAGARRLELRYRGEIGGEPGAGSGYVGEDGVYLSGASGWYPDFRSARVRFSLRASVPDGWEAVSQGERSVTRSEAGEREVRWVERHPQVEIHLAAARAHLIERAGPVATAQVYLRAPDRDGLAERYLRAAHEYLALYETLLGPYPYAKFALVEGFPGAGYGMPSFTLLGPRVLRLPFIVHTSYPHEILHNWWGNGVYVDYTAGNWSEGLTAYLADHWLRERRGEGSAYRRDALQKYRNFVRRSEDFALRDFRGRHDRASAAVGYDKAMMLFHMLRQRVGDRRFVEGLRRFYAEHRFERAGYADLRRAFEEVAGEPLEAFFAQWVERVGAPALRAVGVALAEEGGAFRITGSLEQTQAGPAYALSVPLAVLTREGVEWRAVEVVSKRSRIDLRFESRPLELRIDPLFDLFRRLERAETPPALGELLGAEQRYAVLPSAASAERREAYASLARQLGAREILPDDAIDALPASGAVWVLGWENRFREAVGEELRRLGAELTAGLARIDSGIQPSGLHPSGLHRRDAACPVLIARRGAGEPFAWLGCERAAALPGLARKLPHYSKYGYLVFEGEAPEQRLAGQWEHTDSPLRFVFAPHQLSMRSSIPEHAPLAAPLE